MKPSRVFDTRPRPSLQRVPVVLLTDRQTAVAELRAAGLTRRETAARLGISPAAVKQRLNEARKRAVRKMAESAREPARQEALTRYAKALASGGKPVRIRPFSLINGEC